MHGGKTSLVDFHRYPKGTTVEITNIGFLGSSLRDDNSCPESTNNYHYFDRSVAGILTTKNNQIWFVLANERTSNLVNSALQLPEAQGGCSINKLDPITLFTSRSTGEFGNILPCWAFIGHTGMYPWNILQCYRRHRQRKQQRPSAAHAAN